VPRIRVGKEAVLQIWQTRLRGQDGKINCLAKLGTHPCLVTLFRQESGMWEIFYTGTTRKPSTDCEPEKLLNKVGYEGRGGLSLPSVLAELEGGKERKDGTGGEIGVGGFHAMGTEFVVDCL